MGFGQSEQAGIGHKRTVAGLATKASICAADEVVF